MSRVVKIVLGVFLVAGVSVFAAMRLYTYNESASASMDTIALQQVDAYNQHLVDSAVSFLKSGYVVVRTGIGADSYMLTQMNLKDKTYSHCGIVLIENGYPFVYHSIGGETNPDQRLRRDSASFFFSPKHNLGIGIVSYNYTDECLGKLRTVVHEYYRKRPRFDMKFDLKTDDKLYCAEFIYKSMNKAMGDSQYIKTSHALGYTFVGIDDLYINPHASMIWQIKFK